MQHTEQKNTDKSARNMSNTNAIKENGCRGIDLYNMDELFGRPMIRVLTTGYVDVPR